MIVGSAPIVLIAIYIRVSTEEQAKSGYSLPEQRDACQARANLLAGGSPYETAVFEDTAGGDILERPVLTDMREYVGANHPQYFICLDPDRFSRELFIQLLVTKEIEAAGTQLVFIQHDYQKTPEGQLFYALRGAVSQYEKATILGRTKRGLRRKLQDGKVANGTHPYGYRYNKDTDMLEALPDEANWVQQIFAWAAEHLPPMEICRRLNLLNVPPKHGGLWRSSTVQAMLRNTTYVGQMRCLRWNTAGYKAQRQLPKVLRKITPKQRPECEWRTVAVPAILEQGLFDAVQLTFRTLKRQSRRGAGMLSGLARCGLCGGPIHYNGDRRNYSLRCHNRYPRADALNKPKPCTLPIVSATLMEAKIWAEVIGWFVDPDEIVNRLERQAATAKNDGRQSELERTNAALRAELQEMQSQHDETVKLRIKRLIDPAMAESLLADQVKHIKALTKQLEDINIQLTAVSSAKAGAKTFRERLAKLRELLEFDKPKIRWVLERLDAERKQHVLRNFLSEVRILPDRRYELVPSWDSNDSETKRVPSGARFAQLLMLDDLKRQWEELG